MVLQSHILMFKGGCPAPFESVYNSIILGGGHGSCVVMIPPGRTAVDYTTISPFDPMAKDSVLNFDTPLEQTTDYFRGNTFAIDGAASSGATAWIMPTNDLSASYESGQIDYTAWTKVHAMWWKPHFCIEFGPRWNYSYKAAYIVGGDSDWVQDVFAPASVIAAFTGIGSVIPVIGTVGGAIAGTIVAIACYEPIQTAWRMKGTIGKARSKRPQWYGVASGTMSLDYADANKEFFNYSKDFSNGEAFITSVALELLRRGSRLTSVSPFNTPVEIRSAQGVDVIEYLSYYKDVKSTIEHFPLIRSCVLKAYFKQTLSTKAFDDVARSKMQGDYETSFNCETIRSGLRQIAAISMIGRIIKYVASYGVKDCQGKFQPMTTFAYCRSRALPKSKNLPDERRIAYTTSEVGEVNGNGYQPGFDLVIERTPKQANEEGVVELKGHQSLNELFALEFITGVDNMTVQDAYDNMCSIRTCLTSNDFGLFVDNAAFGNREWVEISDCGKIKFSEVYCLSSTGLAVIDLLLLTYGSKFITNMLDYIQKEVLSYAKNVNAKWTNTGNIVIMADFGNSQEKVRSDSGLEFLNLLKECDFSDGTSINKYVEQNDAMESLGVYNDETVANKLFGPVWPFRGAEYQRDSRTLTNANSTPQKVFNDVRIVIPHTEENMNSVFSFIYEIPLEKVDEYKILAAHDSFKQSLSYSDVLSYIEKLDIVVVCDKVGIDVESVTIDDTTLYSVGGALYTDKGLRMHVAQAIFIEDKKTEAEVIQHKQIFLPGRPSGYKKRSLLVSYLLGGGAVASQLLRRLWRKETKR